MADYRLFCFAESGNSYKCALMLALCGCDWEPRLVDFFASETRSDTYMAGVNEMGEAPVLEHDDEFLSQSGTILDYLIEHTGKFGWRSDTERREVMRWMFFDNHKFTSYFATYRFLTHFLKQRNDVTAFLHDRALKAFAVADKRLEKQDWIALDRPTVADLSMAGYAFYDAETDIDPSEFPALNAWRDRLRALPDWQGPYELMPRAQAENS